MTEKGRLQACEPWCGEQTDEGTKYCTSECFQASLSGRVCSTPGCEREAGSNGYGKCCITCVEGELQGVHLAWCRRRALGDIVTGRVQSRSSMLEHARRVVSIDGNGPQTAFSSEYVALCRAVIECAEQHADPYPGDESCECLAVVIPGHYLSVRLDGGTVVHYRRSSGDACEEVA